MSDSTVVEDLDKPGEARLGTTRGNTWVRTIEIDRDLTGYEFVGALTGNGIEPVPLTLEVDAIDTDAPLTTLLARLTAQQTQALRPGVYRHHLSWIDPQEAVFCFLSGPFEIRER